MGWSSYPPEHKRSFKRAILAYVVVVAVTGGLVYHRADKAAHAWYDHVPHAAADIRTVYVSQITDQASSFSSDNSVPSPGEGEGYIAIVMTDAGLSDTATARALDDLPPQVALAFSPYSQRLDDWLQKAADAKRDSLILIPMEPNDFPKDDPGPQALTARHSEKENGEALSAILSRAPGTVGAMNFMGSGFLSDDRNTRPVFDALKAKNEMFVESPEIENKTVAGDTAKAAGEAYLPGDLRIDADASELAIKKQLLDLETLARKRGYAVGIAQPYPVTFNILKDWADSAERRGIKLVPLSTLLKEKVQHDKAEAVLQKQDSAAPPAQPQGDSQPAQTQPAPQK